MNIRERMRRNVFRTTGGPAPDVTPDAFTFTDITGATVSTVYTSAPITVAGIDAATSISVSGGQYNINGGAFTASAGTVVAGDVVRARVTSSASNLVGVSAVVTIGGVVDTYTVTTAAAADTVPDAFAFTDVTGASLSSVYTSAPITVTGIDAASPISVTGGMYSINGGAFTAAAGTVVNGDVVRAQVTSSAVGSTAANCTVSIGGVTDTYTVTTAAIADLATITIMGGSPLLDATGDYGDATARTGVPADGWVAKATMPYLVGQTFDPTKVTLTISDPGYDGAGAATTVTRTLTGRAVLRRQYNAASAKQISNDGLTFTVYFSLADAVY
jgi:hypothetical protein